MSYTRLMPGFGDISPGRNAKAVKQDLVRIRYSKPTWYLMQEVYLLIEELWTMARKRVPQVEQTPKQGEFRFLNVPIDEDVYEDVMSEYQDGDALMDGMQRYMEIGYKFSFAVNKQNDMVICSMTDRRAGSPYENACLTGGSDSWYDALKVVLYKHEHILKSDWAQAASVAQIRRRLI